MNKSTRNKDVLKTTCKQRISLENKTVLKDKVKDKNLRTNYGITLNEYNAILKNQKHKCKICGVHEKHCNRGVFVDHNHKTGSVRALLCHNCNSGLGHFRDRQ